MSSKEWGNRACFEASIRGIPLIPDKSPNVRFSQVAGISINEHPRTIGVNHDSEPKLGEVTPQVTPQVIPEVMVFVPSGSRVFNDWEGMKGLGQALAVIDFIRIARHSAIARVN